MAVWAVGVGLLKPINCRMFLHAHRLLVDTKLENIDVTAEDPFLHTNFPDWKPTKTICDISDDFADKFKDENSWKIISENDEN